jgi:hypothetical protein
MIEPVQDKETLEMYDALWGEKGSEWVMERLIEGMGGLTRAIIGTRHNNVTFSRAIFEEMANVEVFLEVVRMRLLMFPQSDGSGCLYEDVIKLKKRTVKDLQDILNKGSTNHIANCPYRKTKLDLGCPCIENEPIQPCQKILNILKPIQEIEEQKK